jgi:tetratricopeptide (TPR) repeat protein
MFRIVIVVFMLTISLLVGCQSRPRPAANEAVQVAYDDLYQSRLESSYSSALYHFSIARLVGMEGDLEGAAQALEKAVAADEDSAYLKVTLAEVYLHLDEQEKAFRAAEDALIRDPDLLQGHLLMANLLSANNEYEMAIQHLEKARDLDPESQRITMQLAIYYDRINAMDKAIATLKSIIEASPDNSYARLSLARAYQKTDLVLLAEKTYLEMLENDPESFLAISELGKLYADNNRPEEEISLYLAHLQRFPEDARLRHRLVGTYVDAENLDEAMKHLHIILEQDSSDTTALRKAGLLSFEKSDWQAAADYFQQLILFDQADSQAHYYHGIALEEGALWEEALAAFMAVEKESAVFEDAMIHQAYNLHKLNRTAEAVKLLEQNRQLLASRPEIFEYLSFLYSALEQNQAALEVVEAGLSQYPEDETLLFRRVVLLEQAGDNDAADNAARQLLQINPEHTNALNFLAYSYAVRNERLDEALQMAQKALLSKDEYYIRDTLGWVLYRLGRFEDALAELQLAAEASPDDPVVLEHLGDVLQAMGRREEALSAFQKAVPVGESADTKLLNKIEALRGDKD